MSEGAWLQLESVEVELIDDDNDEPTTNGENLLGEATDNAT